MRKGVKQKDCGLMKDLLKCNLQIINHYLDTEM